MEALRQPRATSREWLGLAVIALPCLLYSMDFTVLNLALPRISAQLRPTGAQMLWIVDIYGFFVSSLLIPMGVLGDRIGRRRLLLSGAAAFGTASVLAAISNSTTLLIIARALLGVAGATLAPSTLSLIRHMFTNSSERTFAIGIWTTSFSVGAAIGPIVGGLVLQYFGWGAVFLIAVPVMVLLLILGPFLLPEFCPSNYYRADLISALQSLVAILMVIYGLKQFAANGWNWLPAIAVITGIMVGLAFVRRQRTLQRPFLDLRLLSDLSFSTPLLAYAFACFLASGLYLFVGQYLQLVLTLSPLSAGVWMLAATLGLAIGSLLSPLMVARLQPTPSMVVGFAVATVSLLVVALVDPRSHFPTLVGGLFVLYLGLAPVFICAVDVMVTSVVPARAGEVAAVAETGSELGSALGVATLGTVSMAVYRGSIASMIPAGIHSIDIQAATDTLGGAFATSQLLPSDLGNMLLNAARTAFDISFRAATALGALIGVSMVVALAAYWRLHQTLRPKRLFSPDADS